MLCEFLVPISVGVISSLIASCIFLFFLTKKRPKVIISDRISRRISKDGHKSFIIKIINKKKRPIINVRARLSYVYKRDIVGGTLPIYEKIPLKTDNLFEISGYDRKNIYGSYAFRFSTRQDLDKDWDDTISYLRFRLICMDSFSNFSRVFNRFYFNKNINIKDGEFLYGNSFEIV